MTKPIFTQYAAAIFSQLKVLSLTSKRNSVACPTILRSVAKHFRPTPSPLTPPRILN